MEVITQDDGYYEKKLLSWLICHVLLLLSSINLNVYVINKCEFDLLIYIFLKYYYISNCRGGGGGRRGLGEAPMPRQAQRDLRPNSLSD